VLERLSMTFTANNKHHNEKTTKITKCENFSLVASYCQPKNTRNKENIEKQKLK